jgi:quercetin dioxygenase-like cupin family protein
MKDAVVLDPAKDGKADIRGSIRDKSLRKIIRMIDADLLDAEQFMGGLATFEPGIKVAPHVHPDAEEVNVVLEGEGVFVTDKGKRPIREGDWQFIPKGVRHGHENTGDTPLTILWLYSPPTGTIPK